MRYLCIGTGAIALAFTSVAYGQGRLIAVDSSRALYEIDQATGAKTPIGTVTSNAGTTGGLAYDPVNQIVYLTSTSLDSLFTLDIATGAATLALTALGNPARCSASMPTAEHSWPGVQ